MSNQQSTKTLNRVIYAGPPASIILGLINWTHWVKIPRAIWLAPVCVSAAIVVGAVLFFFYAANTRKR